MRRLIRWTVIAVLSQGATLILLAWFLPGLVLGGVAALTLVVLLIAGGQALTWPFIYSLAARFHPLLFPVLSFVLSGLLIIWLSDLAQGLGVGGVRVAGLGTAILAVLGLTAGNTLISAMFSLRDTSAYDWFVTRPLRRKYAGSPRSEIPAMLFLEIDGLAEPILRRAIAEGYMPTLQHWLESGTHTLTGWEPDLSSQTSASQAGILLGDNTGIPAFRWYDKASGTVMASSQVAAAQILEQRLSTGNGLLVNDGGSRWNVFSGDAPDSIFTYSTLGDRSRARSARYLAYFANPYTLPRSLALFAGDVIRERWQAWRQVRRNEQPRIRRTLAYAIVRAATTTLMMEASRFMLIADIFRGLPAVYTTFFAYDEVAHHSGADRTDAFKVLQMIDDVIATLERAVITGPRPCHLVILSDHGQSMGATFRQRTGMTLAELVKSLVTPGTQVLADLRSTEDWANINVALHEVVRQERSPAHIVRQAVGRRAQEDAVDIDLPRRPSPPDGPATTDGDVVVLASGNLGLISFPHWPERMSYEDLRDHFPDLIPGLIENEAIGFVMVHSETEGGLVLGRHGAHYLDRGTTLGEDPLANYGQHAARHLKRTDGFTNAPDILVISMFDPATGEVAAFEELVGSHGGLGGLQTQPFVLHPVSLDAGTEPIVGAAALHAILKGWTQSGQQTDTGAAK